MIPTRVAVPRELLLRPLQLEVELHMIVIILELRQQLRHDRLRETSIQRPIPHDEPARRSGRRRRQMVLEHAIDQELLQRRVRADRVVDVADDLQADGRARPEVPHDVRQDVVAQVLDLYVLGEAVEPEEVRQHARARLAVGLVLDRRQAAGVQPGVEVLDDHEVVVAHVVGRAASLFEVAVEERAEVGGSDCIGGSCGRAELLEGRQRERKTISGDSLTSLCVFGGFPCQ